MLVLCGVIAGAFVAGFFVRQYYLDAMLAIDTTHALRKNKWGASVENPQPAKWAISGANQALCPDGSYMVGISVTSKDSSIPGGISAVQPLCRQLNTSDEASAKPK